MVGRSPFVDMREKQPEAFARILSRERSSLNVASRLDMARAICERHVWEQQGQEDQEGIVTVEMAGTGARNNKNSKNQLAYKKGD